MMMEPATLIGHAAALGVVEGLTEFLPISSTGHLILVQQYLDLPDPFVHLFNVFIQLGAILSVFVYFWRELIPWAGHHTPEAAREVWRLWLKVAVAVLPALIIGLFFHEVIEEVLFRPAIVAAALIGGGLFLIWIEARHKPPRVETLGALGYRLAFAIGCIQCVAMVPGLSRSAATIIGSMMLGASRAVAAEFSFFLAIPTMAAAVLYKLIQQGFDCTPLEWTALGVGFVVSFLVAWGVIAFLMHFIRRHSFVAFGWYRIALGALVLVLLNR